MNSHISIKAEIDFEPITGEGAMKWKFKPDQEKVLSHAQKILEKAWHLFGSSACLAAYMAIGTALEESRKSQREKKFRALKLHRPFPLDTRRPE